MLALEQKKAVVAFVSEQAQSASSCVVAEYRGLTVAQMSVLRQTAREKGVFVKVVKNTLARRALADTRFDAVSPALTGAVLLAFSFDEPGAAARVFRDFAKGHPLLSVTCLSLGDGVLAASQLGAVADLPTLSEALASLAATLQSTVSQLAIALNDIPGRVVRVTAAVKSTKQ